MIFDLLEQDLIVIIPRTTTDHFTTSFWCKEISTECIAWHVWIFFGIECFDTEGEMREEDRRIDHLHILHLDIRSDIITLLHIKSLRDQISDEFLMCHTKPWLIDDRFQWCDITSECRQIFSIFF